MTEDIVLGDEPGAELLGRGEVNAYFRKLIASADAQQLGVDITSDTVFSNEPLKDDEGAKLAVVITGLIEANNQLTDERGRTMDPLRTMFGDPEDKADVYRANNSQPPADALR